MKKNIRLFFVIFILLQLPALLNAQVFLHLAGYKGRSTTGYVPGLIDVASMGNTITCSPCTTPVPKTTGISQPGKIVFNTVNSPDVVHLKDLLLKGTITPSACFVFANYVTDSAGTGQTLFPYYYIILSNVSVLEIDETSPGQRGTCQVSLTYSAITYTYKRIDKNNRPVDGVPVTTGWDFATNAATTLPIPAGL